jgi:hypothetical protein
MPQIGFSRSRAGARPMADGCGNWLFTCLISLLFLLLNVALIQNTYKMFVPLAPEYLQDVRMAQAIAILGPILLLLIEWWLVEFLADLLALRRTRKAKAGSSSRAG